MRSVTRASLLVESGWSSMDMSSILNIARITQTKDSQMPNPQDAHQKQSVPHNVPDSDTGDGQTARRKTGGCRAGPILVLSAVAVSNQFGAHVILSTLWPYINSVHSTSKEACETDIAASLMIVSVLLFSVAKTLSGLVYGYAADKMNAVKPILLISEIFSLASMLLYVYLSQIYSTASCSSNNSWIYAITCTVRVLLGLGAGNSALIKSQIAISSTEEERGKAMSKLTIAQSVGIILAHVTVFGFSYLQPSYHINEPYMSINVYTTPAWIAAFWRIINMVLLAALYNPTSNRESSSVKADIEVYEYNNTSDNKQDMRTVCVCILLNAVLLSAPDFINNMVSPFLCQVMNHTEENSVTLSSVTFMSSGALSLIGIILVLVISHRCVVKERRILGTSILLFLVSVIFLIPFQGTDYDITYWQLVASVGIIAIATPLFKSSLATIYSKALASKRQGLMTALITAPFSKLLALAYAMLYKDNGTAAAISVLVCLLAITLLFFIFMFYRLLVPYDINVEHNNNTESV